MKLLGVIGRGYRGDIAIDDISFNNDCQFYSGVIPTSETLFTTPAPTPKTNNCKRNEFGCWSDAKCIDKNQVCDFTIDCADNSDERTCRKWSLKKFIFEHFP